MKTGDLVMFDHIAGHREAVLRLQRYIAEGRFPHAMLFAGPESVGKLLAAKAFAAGLLCRGAAGAQRPCGECLECSRVAGRSHPGLMLIAPEGQGGQIRIDQIRALQREAAMTPAGSGFRIAIIDDADRMNLQAANSLLKFLEEPPPAMVVILVASRPDALLPTVVSRCGIVRFRALPAADIAAVLAALGYEGPKIAAAARLSGGRVGAAVRLLEGGFAVRDQALEALEGLARGAPGIWEASEAKQLSGREFSELLNHMALLLRDILVLRTTGRADLLFNLDVIERLQAFLPTWDERRVLAALTALGEAQRSAEVHAAVRLAFEGLLLRLLQIAEGA